ncbi:NADH-quinone oxidoreductase subunit NuoG [Salinispira pacifica]
MVTIYIDGIAFEVPEDKNLLETCQNLGINVPYFCWHPALHSVGACRQCAVKQFRDEKDTRGRIIMSCMAPVTDGMRVSVNDPEAIEFRKSVGEWLMLNHPHDCPICDEGGECHLQDMIVMTRHNYRRTAFPKRTFVNQQLGPFIHQEMNRCIQCYRCVRFYKDYAEGDDFDALGSHDSVFFGREKPGTLESPFSGNLIEVCPTGVFTDKTYKKHYIRKWDLQQAPSICTGCSLGCNTFVSERYGTVRRIRNRYSAKVNGYFLCDRGRFGYEQVNSEQRIRRTRLAGADGTREAAREDAVTRAREMIAGASGVIGIGSPRASVETNYMLQKLVGESNFYAGVSPKVESLVELVHQILRDGPVASASLREVERCDAVLVLGEDPVNSAPMLELALKQAARVAPVREAQARTGAPVWDDKAQRVVVQDRRGPVYNVTTYPTSIDRLSKGTLRRAPADIARFAHAVAHLLDPSAPEVGDLDDETAALAEKAAEALRGAERPLVVSGTSALSAAVIEGAANVARSLRNAGKEVRQFFVLPEQNSMGLAMLAPRPLDEAVERVRSDGADLVLLAENDLERRAAEKDAKLLLESVPIIVLDSLPTSATEHASVLLPAASFAESSGTVVNNEGRAQRFFRAMEPAGDALESWKWLAELAQPTANAAPSAVGGDGAALRDSARVTLTLDSLLEEIEAEAPVFSGIKRAAPGPGRGAPKAGIPRQSFRFSGRTAIHASEDVREHRVHEDPDSPLRYSMEGRVDPAHPGIVPEYWVPGWNSVQALNRFQEEVGGPMRGGEPGVLLFGRAAEAESAAGPNAGDGDRTVRDRSDGDHTAVTYFDAVPAAFRREGEKLATLPLSRIFGGEELSSRAPAISERTESPYAGLSESDGRKRGIRDGATVTIRAEGESNPRRLPVRLIAGLPEGILLLPEGVESWNGGRTGYATIEGSD